MIYIVCGYEDYFGKRRGYDGGKWPLDFTSNSGEISTGIWTSVDRRVVLERKSIA